MMSDCIITNVTWSYHNLILLECSVSNLITMVLIEMALQMTLQMTLQMISY